MDNIDIVKNRKNTIIFALALVGFLIAAYLSKQYLFNQTVICLTGGCEKVRLSPLSKIYGIPVPVFGLAGYTLIVIMAFLRTLNAELEKKLLKPIFVVALGGLLFSAYNNFVDWFIIKTFCQYCFGCLLIMIGLVVASKLEMRDSHCKCCDPKPAN
jgi:uncharacterized membrane protein